jgi:hypothetical protein
MADYIEGQDLVKQDAYDAVLKLDKMMGDLVAKFDLVAKSAISMNDTIVKSTSIPEVKENQNTQKKNLDEIIKLEEKLKQAISDKGKVIELLRMEIAKQNAANKELVKDLQAQETSYNKLDLTLKKLKASYKAMTEAETQSTKGKELLSHIQQLDTKLKALDATMGVHNRKVGNYTNATFQLTQVMRELPNFAQSAEIGIRSLSNNLPMLADSFGQVRKEAGGTLPALKIFASSLFSFAGIFPLVLMGLITYSKEIIAFGKELFTTTNYQKELNDALLEGSKNATSELNSVKRLYEATQDTTLSVEQRKKAVDELQKLYPAYFQNINDETILNGGASKQYNELTRSILAAAKAKAIESKITEIINADLEKEMELQAKVDKANLEFQSKMGQPMAYAGQYGQGGAVGGLNPEQADAYRKIQRNNAKMDLDQFKKSQNDKLKVLEDAILKENQIISNNGGSVINDKPTTTTKTSSTTKAPKAPKAGKTDRPSRTLIQKPVAVDFLTDEQNLRELELLDARIQEMNDKTDLDMIARIKKRAEEIKRINEQYAKDELEVIKSNLEAQDADIAKIDEERMARLEAYVKIINSAIDIIGTVTSAISEKITSQTEKEIEAIDAREQAELDAIDRLTLSDSEREERKKIVELQAEERRKKAEEDKIRDLRKYALFQKGIDTAGIIANTALAVTKQLGITPLPAGALFVSAIVAAGAAQLAKVLATPLPQYELGTPEGGHTGGKAIVGEAGTELGRTPDGKLFLTPSKASIMDLPKRTEIIPHDITKDLLGATMVRLAQANTAVSLDMYQDELIEAFERGTDKITKAIYKNRTNISIGGSYRDYVKSNQL